MPYLDFSGSSSTQSPEERAAEARRILTRIGPVVRQDAERDEIPRGRGWTPAAMRFVCEQLGALELTGKLGNVTPAMLLWLRDLAEAID